MKMNNETIGAIVCITLIAILFAFIVGVYKMKDDVNYSSISNVKFDALSGEFRRGENSEEPRFKVVQSYNYNLNGYQAVVRIAVIRDLHDGSEYMITRDPDSGLVVTKLSATGH